MSLHKSHTPQPEYPVPPNWTDHKIEEEWDSPDGRGQVVTRAFGLGPGQPILEDEEGQTQIIQSGEKFYMWDEMNDEIYEFACQDLGEIYHALHNGGLQKLDRWLLEEVGPLIH
ncbi:hypothetical protein N7481_008285 [Penicillium waksmanii]|uniref:uncharacterized protein n=1 Tax=Penicillium waksmanii TaxID=69791 RepID=UPI002547471E|nr:uncharacterized protein N7481_008285 [Penicillium waksmanii]KAJ5980987.1 hypothetical protein N7481_008285 [Penicillium waksmanii]